MVNATMKLDTLAYSKKLIAAGCERKLAEAHASLQQDVLVEISEDYLSQFATKLDLEGLKQEMNAKFALVDHKIDALSTKITVKLGALMTTLVFVMAALLKFHG